MAKVASHASDQEVTTSGPIGGIPNWNYPFFSSLKEKLNFIFKNEAELREYLNSFREKYPNISVIRDLILTTIVSDYETGNNLESVIIKGVQQDNGTFTIHLIDQEEYDSIYYPDRQKYEYRELTVEEINEERTSRIRQLGVSPQLEGFIFQIVSAAWVNPKLSLDDFRRVISTNIAGDIPPLREAPALWKRDRLIVDGKPETPVSFVQRNYATWMNNGLNKSHIRQLDFDLYNALLPFLSERTNKRKKKELPDDFKLPTLSESREDWVSRVGTSTNFDLEDEPTLETAQKLEARAKAIRRGLKKAPAI